MVRRKKKTSEYTPVVSIIDHKAYVYYRESSKMCNRENVKDYVDYGKILSEFYRIVGEKIVESKNGVYLKNIGYFGVIVNQTVPKILSYDKVKNSKIRLDERYMLTFIPINKNKYIRTYFMDYAFCKTVRRNLYKRLMAGYKYNFNSSIFFSDLGKKKTT